MDIIQTLSIMHKLTSLLNKFVHYVTVFPKGFQAKSAKMADIEIFCVCHFHFTSAKLKKICSDIAKFSGPWSSTSKNSGGLMKTLIVLVLLSSKKSSKGNPSIENVMLKKLVV